MSRFLTSTLLAFSAMFTLLQAASLEMEDPCVGLNCPVVVSIVNQPLEVDLHVDEATNINQTIFNFSQANTQQFQFAQSTQTPDELLNLNGRLITDSPSLNLQLDMVAPTAQSLQPTYISRQVATISLGFQHGL